ncbi:MAG: hypothetical protein LAP38_21520 [Acidobacteriia bacterium]|nr:hypothetical protein [Terriglobia bacterium]
MKHALAICALLAVFVWLARRQIFTWPYYYDEADYMYAASLGWRANYTGSPAQPLADFVRVGLARGGDASERSELSAQTRAGRDVDFYRHWHGPLYSYWLLALAPLRLDERVTRSLSYGFPALTLLVIYLGSLWLLPGGQRQLAAILGSIFYLWSYTTTVTNEIAPHSLFVLCYVAALILLMKWRITSRSRYWYGAVIAAALAFCTLEVAFVLVVVLLVCAALEHKLTDWRWMSKSIVLFAGTVLVLWPAAVLKLSFVKAYLFMSYLAIFRKSPWGGVSFAETWRLRFTHSPWEWLLLAAAVILYFRFCDVATRRLLFPIFFYAGLMLLVLLRVNTETPRYMLPFLAALQVGAGFTFATIFTKWRLALRSAPAAAICGLLLWNTTAQIRAHPILPAPRLASVLASLREQKLTGKKLLVPQDDLPMIHYYFPGTSLRGYVNEQERSAALAHERFDAVLDRDKTLASRTSVPNDER